MEEEEEEEDARDDLVFFSSDLTHSFDSRQFASETDWLNEWTTELNR